MRPKRSTAASMYALTPSSSRDVGSDGQRVAAELAGDGRRAILVPVDDDDVGPLLGEPSRDAGADAASRTGDDGDLPGQSRECHLPSFARSFELFEDDRQPTR